MPKDSPLAGVADLKGKKVALNKGSNVHYLLVRALEAAGVAWGDVEPVYLPPADARAAFERGAVDAWVIWDPFLAAAEAATGARTWPTAPAWSATTSSTWPRNPSPPRTPRSCRRSSTTWPRSTAGPGPTPARSRRCSGRGWESRPRYSRWPWTG